jgi:phosphoenolpyruvate-protein kinase (PTS system EI component)
MSESSTKSGVSVVEGIGVGRAVLWRAHPAPAPVARTFSEEQSRLARGVATARRGLEELVRLLPRAEVELFEPELLMIDELRETLRARLRAGQRAEDVIEDVLADAVGDLLLDARARILDAIAHDERTVDDHLEGSEGNVVLVTDGLTPSVVASLPARVVAIVAAIKDLASAPNGAASHAAILARGRDIPLALVDANDLGGIAPNDVLLVDTTAEVARVEIGPNAATREAAEKVRSALAHSRAEFETEVASPLGHLGLAVLVNIGSLRERVPSSSEGIGLLRTELFFADRETAPSEAEQFGVLCAVAAEAPRSLVIVRLFDAGGDKPLAWLPSSEEDPARGIALLSRHTDVLDLQLRAILRARAHGDLRVLVPFVEHAHEVSDVRGRLRGRLPVGALIETQDAVERIDAIVEASDFVSIGTNDLSASVAKCDRADVGVSPDARVLRLVARVIASARAQMRTVTVCGEMAGDAHGARILVGLGAQALSVAPARLVPVKLSLRNATLEDCRKIAGAAAELREARA